jgi:hypothetical protein
VKRSTAQNHMLALRSMRFFCVENTFLNYIYYRSIHSLFSSLFSGVPRKLLRGGHFPFRGDEKLTTFFLGTTICRPFFWENDNFFFGKLPSVDLFFGENDNLTTFFLGNYHLSTFFLGERQLFFFAHRMPPPSSLRLSNSQRGGPSARPPVFLSSSSRQK